MGDSSQKGEAEGADGQASEEGWEEGERERDTCLPASEGDERLVEDGEGGPPPQSWPGKGGPGTFPAPG